VRVLADLMPDEVFGPELRTDGVKLSPEVFQGDPAFCSAAIVVSLARSDLDSERGRQLAEVLPRLPLSVQTSTVERAVGAISACELFSNSVEEFLLKAYQVLDPNDSKGRAAAISGLNDSLRRGESNLSQAEVYSRLSLPRGIFELLGTA